MWNKGPRSRTSLMSVCVCVCVFETAAFLFCKEEAFFCQAFHQIGIRRGGHRKGWNLLQFFSPFDQKFN